MSSDEKLRIGMPAASGEFDMMAEDLAGELFPDSGVAGRVTPWKNAIYKVVLGIALSIVQLNYGGLNYILPLFGTILLLIGCRALRTQNKGFKVLYVSAVIMAVLRAFQLISAASCLWRLKGTGTIDTTLGLLGILITFLLLAAFRMGLAGAMEKSGADQKTGWATAACVWYIIVLLMGITGLSRAYVTVLTAVYLVIIIALMIQASKMDKAGYALEPVPSNTSDLALAGIYLGIVVIGIAVCGLFFTRLPMGWQQRSGGGRSTEVSRQAEEQLKAQGMPENVLSDLGDEDLSLLCGADRVIVQELPENADNDPVLGGLLMTHVAVRVPGNGTHYKYKWRFIHHFELPGEQRFAGIETIKVDALCKVVNSQGQLIDNGVTELSGRVLMDKAGSICEAPYYGRTLGRIVFDDEDYIRPGWNILSLDRTLFSLECSFPRKTENARGYIMYAADFYMEGAAYISEIEYWHNKNFYYPLTDPAAPHDTVIPGCAYMDRSEQMRISTGE